MSEQREKLTSLLNASGFAFQLAVESAVSATRWRTTSREHPYEVRGATRYADLILSRGQIHLVVECKRVRNADWLFLMPDEGQMSRSRARVAWTDIAPEVRPLTDWGDVQIYPSSPESHFCAVRGQGEKDSPLLERIAAGVAESAQAIAEDIMQLHQGSRRVDVLLPVVVTSATLHLAAFNPATVDLGRGDIDNATFSTATHVRFRKSLAPSRAVDPTIETLSELNATSERTVFVVNAAHLVQWLNDLELGMTSRPWEYARSVSAAPR